MAQSIETKEIRGITIKQIATYSAFIISAALLYFGNKVETLRNREETIKNRELMQEFKNEWKEQQRFNDIRMKEHEQLQRLMDIRLTVVETQIKK